jgi:hypothetical protein
MPRRGRDAGNISFYDYDREDTKLAAESEKLQYSYKIRNYRKMTRNRIRDYSMIRLLCGSPPVRCRPAET